MRLETAGVLLAAILAQPSLVHADSFVVRSGSVRIDTTNPSAYNIEGDGFLVAGTDFRGSIGAQVCVPECPAGTPIDLSLTLGGPLASFNLGQGNATIDGTEYPWPDLFLTGEFTFDAPVAPIPDNGELTLALFAPFVFSGRVVGAYERPVVTPLFDLPLTGRGTAVVSFYLLDESRRTYQFSGAGYRFAEPVPEPATLLLVASGAAALAARRRRRRRPDATGS